MMGLDLTRVIAYTGADGGPVETFSWSDMVAIAAKADPEIVARMARELAGWESGEDLGSVNGDHGDGRPF